MFPVFKVIRRFDSFAYREQLEDAFYGSDDWRLGPQEARLGLIDNFVDIVIELDNTHCRSGMNVYVS